MASTKRRPCFWCHPTGDGFYFIVCYRPGGTGAWRDVHWVAAHRFVLEPRELVTMCEELRDELDVLERKPAMCRLLYSML